MVGVSCAGLELYGLGICLWTFCLALGCIRITCIGCRGRLVLKKERKSRFPGPPVFSESDSRDRATEICILVQTRPMVGAPGLFRSALVKLTLRLGLRAPRSPGGAWPPACGERCLMAVLHVPPRLQTGGEGLALTARTTAQLRHVGPLDPGREQGSPAEAEQSPPPSEETPSICASL